MKRLLAIAVALSATVLAQSPPNVGSNPTGQLLAELIRLDNSNPPGHENQIDE